MAETVETGAPAPDVNPADSIVGVDYENGQLVFEYAQPEVPADPAPAPAPEPKPEPTHDFEKRYNDLLPEFTRKSEELKRAVERLEALENEVRTGKPPGETPTPENADPWGGVDLREALLDEDGTKFKSIVEKAVAARVSSIINPVLEQLVPFVEHVSVAGEVNELLTKYPDSVQYAEDIRAVLNLEGTAHLSLEDAYKVAKGARERFGTTAAPKKESEQPPVATPASSPAPAQKPTREELEQRAARLKSPADTGRAGTVVEPERRIDSVRSAFDAALADLTAGRKS